MATAVHWHIDPSLRDMSFADVNPAFISLLTWLHLKIVMHQENVKLLKFYLIVLNLLVALFFLNSS